MVKQVFMLLLAVVFMVNAAVLAPANIVRAVSQPTCGCTTTITEYRNPRPLRPRQGTCPPPSTVTVTVAPPLATIAVSDPASISSAFSYDSAVDSAAVLHSSQDRPTGEPPETTSLFFTHTASGPAIVGTESPGESVYHGAYTTAVPVATTTIGFPPADKSAGSRTGSQVIVTKTMTTYLSTAWVTIGAADSPAPTPAPTNTSVVVHNLQKRQTCSMVFAILNGVWASWCNNWDGHTVVSYSTYNTTVLVTTPPGASPIPETVYDPSLTIKGASTSLTASESVTSGLSSASVASTQPVPTSDTSASVSSAVVASIVVTASVVITQPIVTLTETFYASASASDIATSTSSAAEAPSSCGQVGNFVITFDDLPSYSTNDPNTDAAPPIFAPYDHFYWASGYGYGPPPNSNYSAINGGRMAEYNPADGTPAPTTAEGRDLPGSFGAGPRAANNIFWFDATSAYVGCNNTNPDLDCTLTATGYRWNATLAANGTIAKGQEVMASTQQFTVPRCISAPCMLTQIYFGTAQFTGLSTVNLIAQAGGQQMKFYLDSFDLNWTNNTCAAGIARQSSRK